MVDNVNKPTRSQLERVARGDYRLLVALENLFENVEETGTVDVNASLYSATLSLSQAITSQQIAEDAIAQSAIAAPNPLSQSASNDARDALAAAFLPHSPIPEADPFPAVKPPYGVGEIQGISIDGVADGDLLQWDATERQLVPVSGASGSWTAGSGETITATNGLITSIV